MTTRSYELSQLASAYDVTAAETAAGVTPTNFAYPPGDARRYGVTGDGSTNDAPAIQSWINVLAVYGGVVRVFSPAVGFKINTAITHPANVSIDFGNAMIDASAIASGAAWTITAGGTIQAIRCPLIGANLKGVASPADGVYAASTNGINFQTSQVEIKNVLVQGFQYGYTFDTNSYVIRLNHCAAWYNKRAWNSDQSGHTNMGSDLLAIGGIFAHNDQVVYNNLCEVTFEACAFDSMVKGIVEDNINSSGGAYNGYMLFRDCHFENGGNVSFPWFKNSGLMIIRDPKFYGSATYSYLFDNSGVINLDGGFSRVAIAGTYSSRNTGSGMINVYGIRPVDFNGENFRLSASESGIYNSDFELGTTAGWAVTTGAGANLTVANTGAHLGTYCLKMVSGGAAAAFASYPIPIRAGTKQLLLNMYVQNPGPTNIFPTLTMYTATGTAIGTAEFQTVPAATVAWTRFRFQGLVPASASYAIMSLAIGIAENQPIYFDDLYMNPA